MKIITDIFTFICIAIGVIISPVFVIFISAIQQAGFQLNRIKTKYENHERE